MKQLACALIAFCACMGILLVAVADVNHGHGPGHHVEGHGEHHGEHGEHGGHGDEHGEHGEGHGEHGAHDEHGEGHHENGAEEEAHGDVHAYLGPLSVKISLT